MKKRNFRISVTFAHVILLLFVPGEDADFADVGRKETRQNGVAEGASSPSDK